MKIVVTGGAGFIGSSLVESWLNQDAEVHVVDNLRSGDEKNLCELDVVFHKVDITDRDSVFDVMEGCKYVFNFAAMVSVPESFLKPDECRKINVEGLKNILDAAIKFKVEKVIHSSSAAIYGDSLVFPKIENMIPEPKSPYGNSKLEGERLCNFYSDTYGLKTNSLRYFNVFGPKQNLKTQYASAIPIFINNAINNNDIIIYGDGLQTRDFVFVKDVTNANILAAQSDNKKGVYNIACGSTISIKELAEKIINFTDSKSKIIFEKERVGDIKHSHASIEKAKNEIGFSPQFDFEDSLKKTIEFYQNKKSG